LVLHLVQLLPVLELIVILLLIVLILLVVLVLLELLTPKLILLLILLLLLLLLLLIIVLLILAVQLLALQRALALALPRVQLEPLEIVGAAQVPRHMRVAHVRMLLEEKLHHITLARAAREQRIALVGGTARRFLARSARVIGPLAPMAPVARPAAVPLHTLPQRRGRGRHEGPGAAGTLVAAADPRGLVVTIATATAVAIAAAWLHSGLGVVAKYGD
jgi:ABC-type multidrug transport system fused ATPase/permease subunit